ncbi:hypothetical protein [Spirosoma aerophilum]
MHVLHPLIEALNSFHNLYKVVLNCIERDTKSVGSLSPVLGLTLNSTRHRLKNPRLWQLSEIEKIADYYQLPSGACSRLCERLPLLVSFCNQLEQEPRKQFEKQIRQKPAQLVKRVQAKGLVVEIDALYRALNELLTL